MKKCQLASILYAIFILACLVAACSGANPAPLTTPTESQAYPAAIVPGKSEPYPPSQSVTPGNDHPVLKPVELEALKTLEYDLPILAEAMPATGGIARLVDGAFEAQYPGSTSQLLVNYVRGAQGDLNGDGAGDAAAILAVNPGGSGTFIQLAAVAASRGGPQHVATVPLGDRVQVENLAIEDGLIVIDLIVHDSDDPLCCPTQKERQTYRLVGDMLAQIPQK